MQRKKTALENLFNLNRYRKRKGSSAISDSFKNVDYQQLKNTIIVGEPDLTFQGFMKKDVNEHLEHLRNNFLGQSELCFYHAKLIVLIRREAQLTENYARFEDLWHTEADFLLEKLDMRWLISACDTFIDHSNNDTFRAILLNAVILVNTVKLYETENFLLGHTDIKVEDYLPEQLEKGKNCFNLFDNIPSFRVGVDDTLRNMRWRMEDVAKSEPLAHQILSTIFERITSKGSVYTRFRQAHIKDRNAWWHE